MSLSMSNHSQFWALNTQADAITYSLSSERLINNNFGQLPYRIVASIYALIVTYDARDTDEANKARKLLAFFKQETDEEGWLDSSDSVKTILRKTLGDNENPIMSICDQDSAEMNISALLESKGLMFYSDTDSEDVPIDTTPNSKVSSMK